MNTELLPQAIDFYEKGNSMAATARTFHSTPATLKKLFQARGVKIRNQSEQCIIENMKRAKSIDHFYFNELTQEKAYYLGFLAADGTVRKDRNEIKIGLSSVDKEFLEKFKSRLQADTKIHTYVTSNGFECSELRFSSLKIKQDLAKYGIVPNKTFKGINLSAIPETFKLAFIKGFFDGDGSFNFDGNTKQGKVRFTSYTKEILEEIQLYLQIQGYIYKDKRREQLFYLEFSTLPSIKIMHLFYNLDTPCLERKKEKFKEFLELRNNNPRDKGPLDEGEKIC